MKGKEELRLSLQLNDIRESGGGGHTNEFILGMVPYCPSLSALRGNLKDNKFSVLKL